MIAAEHAFGDKRSSSRDWDAADAERRRETLERDVTLTGLRLVSNWRRAALAEGDRVMVAVPPNAVIGRAMRCNRRAAERQAARGFACTSVIPMVPLETGIA
jgi:hypothetical protein